MRSGGLCSSQFSGSSSFGSLFRSLCPNDRSLWCCRERDLCILGRNSRWRCSRSSSGGGRDSSAERKRDRSVRHDYARVVKFWVCRSRSASNASNRAPCGVVRGERHVGERYSGAAGLIRRCLCDCLALLEVQSLLLCVLNCSTSSYWCSTCTCTSSYGRTDNANDRRRSRRVEHMRRGGMMQR